MITRKPMTSTLASSGGMNLNLSGIADSPALEWSSGVSGAMWPMGRQNCGESWQPPLIALRANAHRHIRPRRHHHLSRHAVSAGFAAARTKTLEPAAAFLRGTGRVALSIRSRPRRAQAIAAALHTAWHGTQ